MEPRSDTSSPESSNSRKFPVPTIEEIRTKCHSVFGLRACRLQCLFAQAVLERKDVLFEVGTGGGKTLAFWLPLLFRKDGLVIVVTALNALGDQNVSQLQKASIKAIAINGNTATTASFQVSVCRAT